MPAGKSTVTVFLDDRFLWQLGICVRIYALLMSRIRAMSHKEAEGMDVRVAEAWTGLDSSSLSKGYLFGPSESGRKCRLGVAQVGTLTYE